MPCPDPQSSARLLIEIDISYPLQQVAARAGRSPQEDSNRDRITINTAFS